MKGILVNYEYCTGCHSCEVACKKELGLPKGEYGIKIDEFGPVKITVGPKAGKWEWAFFPMVTKSCDLCEGRIAKGKMPMCVQHCQAWCLAYGEVEDLVRKVDGKTRYALLVPEQS
ncbi:oxidoreductase [Gordonibacter sp. 28C]|uniref:oxidoreductase n=1 Tax=Gordonibacter sp. 28C TaxID=2078569 RepID=UPI000DF7930D|nr:oxidoreductase [Gordonibacter sp. 28C]RDB59294.1 oxidoreductase [Gordonibacter sp. 28C]